MSLSAARAISRLLTNNNCSQVTVVSSDRPSCFRWFILACLLVNFGCQAVHNRIVARSEHCGELCARARAARENGDSVRANQYINEALRQKPNDLEMRRQLAETMWSSGRQDEAVAQYLVLCEERPSEVKLSERLAVLQWDNHQQFAAANTAMSVLRLDPLSKEALLIKARNDVHHGKLDEALVSYIKLNQIHSNDPVILKELGELYLKRDQPDRACPLFRTALQESPVKSSQRFEIEWLLGVAYARSDRWTMAVDILERSISTRQATSDDWCLLGIAHLQTGDLDAARADLQRATKSGAQSEATRRLSEQLKAASDFLPDDPQIIPASYQPK